MREHGHRGVMALFTVEEICEVLSAKSPAELPWKAMGVDLVIESTGLFTDVEKAQGHIRIGAAHIQAPPRAHRPRA